MRGTQARDDSSGTVLRTRPLQLRFRDRELERQFLLSYRAAARPWIRMSLVVALSTVLGFTIIDHWLLVGPRLARPDVWRFGLQLPLVLIMMGLTSPRLYLRWYQRGGDYSHEHAVQRADLALYATKARGRDGWSAAVEADAVSGVGGALLKTAS